MKILVYGAGVIGTLYAARLQRAGHHVTVLARRTRLADIQRQGLVLEDVMTNERSVTPVAVVEHLRAEDRYDVALVTVRRDQLSGIMPDLAFNRNIPSVLFMLNNPLCSSALIDALGPDRVVLGFPGAGGTLEGHAVHYAIIAQQRTTVGEPNGKQTARLRTLVEALRGCGFRTRVDNDMDAWLTSHAFFVTSVSGAIYLSGGDCGRLSRSQPLLKLMVDGVFSHRIAEFIFARHARQASAEMQMLSTDCRLLLGKSGVPAPALDRLNDAIDNFAMAAKRQAPPAG